MFAGMTDRQWLWCAAAFYAVALLRGTASLVKQGRPSGGFIYAAILVGYVLQFIGLGIRGHAAGGCPLGNQFEILQFTAWSAISLYLVVGVTFRSSILGYFTSCLGAALTIVSLSIPALGCRQADPHLRRQPLDRAPRRPGDLQLRRLRPPRPHLGALPAPALSRSSRSASGGWFSFLPSILDLDHIEVRLLGTGLALLTLALAFGAVYWSRDTATVGHAKLAATVAVWAVSAVALRAAGHGAPARQALRLDLPRALRGRAPLARGGGPEPPPGSRAGLREATRAMSEPRLFVIGATHHSAPLEVRERLAARVRERRCRATSPRWPGSGSSPS